MQAFFREKRLFITLIYSVSFVILFGFNCRYDDVLKIVFAKKMTGNNCQNKLNVMRNVLFNTSLIVIDTNVNTTHKIRKSLILKG